MIEINMEEAKSLLSPLLYSHLLKHVECEGYCPIRSAIIADMDKRRNVPLTHRVLMHKEHDPSDKAEHFLCEYHYLTAESCDMLDADYGLVYRHCSICS